MHSLIRVAAIAAIVLSFSLPAVAASRTQKRDGSSGGTPIRKMDRKKDGSGAGQQKQQGGKGAQQGSGQQKRDGSCK